MAAFFTVAGINHFLRPGLYLKIMPPFLPFPLFLVYLSGLLESVLGLALVPRKLEKQAGWGLTAVLIGIFPANVYMTLRPDKFPAIPSLVLWLRLPLQLVLIALVLWSAGSLSKRGPDSRNPD